jgi:hypothetical protein
MLRETIETLRERRKARHAPTVFISYPKSGRTWLRLMLGKALRDHYELNLAKQRDLLAVQKFSKIDRRVPPLDFSHDGLPCHQTREELKSSKSDFMGKDVILLCRDPRDVVISSWYRREKHTIKYGIVEFEGSISDFVRHPVHGIEKIVAFMNIWAANRETPARLLLVRYEDLIDAPENELRRLLIFLGVENVSDVIVSGAVRYASFDNMQTLEREDTLNSGRLRPLRRDDPSTFKVRRGKPGGFRDDLKPDDIAYVNKVVAKLLDDYFGY